MKTNTVKQVVVFGREGLARDQLVTALTELNVVPVWVGRPSQSNPEALVLLNPNKIIISLEPSIEDELEPYIEYLSQSTLSVLYDDADITRNLSGWELNRWARHLASKVLDKDDLPAAPKQEADIKSTAVETNTLAIDIPEAAFEDSAHTLDLGVPLDVEASENPWVDTQQYGSLEIDSDELNAALEKLNSNLASSFDADEILEMSFEQVKPLSREELAQFNANLDSEGKQKFSIEDIDAALQDQSAPHLNVLPALEQSDLQQFIHEAESVSSELKADQSVPLQLESITDGLDWVLDTDEVELNLQTDTPGEELADYDLSKFALVDDIPAGVDFKAHAVSTQIEKPVIEETVVDLIVAISGLGGPGAVRGLVQQVPENFRGLMVSAHHFTSAQLVPLREQLSKIARVPVEIAEPEEFLKNGRIYLFPHATALYSTPLGYQCVPGKWSSYIDSMDQAAQFIILSGADTSLTQSLIQVGALSNSIHVQDPEHCFDATLVQQLINVGTPIMSPDIVSQWFS